MRLLITMSDSGPDPRSHSPLLRASSLICTASRRPVSRRRFDLSNLVSKLRSLLVVLALNGFLHFSPQTDQFRLALGIERRAAGALADVGAFAVNVQDQGVEFLLKADVVVRAAQPALIAELEKRDPADRAGLLVEPGQFLRRAADQLLGQGPGQVRTAGRFVIRLGQVFAGVFFAKMQLLGFAARQFGDVKCRRFFALEALHRTNFAAQGAHIWSGTEIAAGILTT